MTSMGVRTLTVPLTRTGLQDQDQDQDLGQGSKNHKPGEGGKREVEDILTGTRL